MRRYQRLTVQLPVIFRINGEQTVHPGTTIDIGAGGIHCTSNSLLATKSVVILAFKLPTTQKITVRGQIVASYFSEVNNEFRHRISFTKISNKHQTIVQRYVEQELRTLASIKMRSQPLMLAPGLPNAPKESPEQAEYYLQAAA